MDYLSVINHTHFFTSNDFSVFYNNNDSPHFCHANLQIREKYKTHVRIKSSEYTD